MKDKFEKILETHLKELEDARNVQTKADALTLLREHLQNMNMFVEYEMKIANLVNFKKEKEI